MSLLIENVVATSITGETGLPELLLDLIRGRRRQIRELD